MLFSSLLAVVSVAVVRITRLDPMLGRWLAGLSLTFCVYAALPPWLERPGRRPDRPAARVERAGRPGNDPGRAARAVRQRSRDGPLGARLLPARAALLHLPLLHHRAGRRARAERLTLTLTLAMYLGFVGYVLFPALGPIGAMPGLRPLGSNVATETVAAYGVALGTFPSLHAGVCAAVAIDGWRTSRRSGSSSRSSRS